MNPEQPPADRPQLLSSADRRRRVVPPSFQLAGLALNAVSLLRNEWAARVLARLWFTVFRSKPKPWVAEFWSSADSRIELPVDDVAIPVHRWGEGPPVVMMHGWSGSGTQFREFIAPLVGAGHSVICFDAPEHGNNPGRRTHMLRFVASLLAIEAEFGPVDAVVAHSLGAMAATWAWRRDFLPRRTVLIAPHLDLPAMFETYRELLGMRPALAARFRELIGARMQALLDGEDPWQALTPERLLARPGDEGMLVFDREDPEVAAELFEEFVARWSGCAVLETRGLGHTRILRDAAVIGAVVDFLRA